MKKDYKNPEMEIIKYDTPDVMATLSSVDMTNNVADLTTHNFRTNFLHE